MKALGLDIGARRIGIARADETGVLAVPLQVYWRRSFSEDVEFLVGLLRAEGAEALVVGLPLNMDGTEGEQARKVRELAETVAKISGLPLFFVDERWTTQEAERAMREVGKRPSRRKEEVDALSAVLILQAWLDSRKCG